jgi:hypothetical protein
MATKYVVNQSTIMKKRRGHYCRICGNLKPNEAFSGKGHRNHICKKCARLPKEKREEIEYKDEIFNYLRCFGT